jgi:hypothetical protein
MPPKIQMKIEEKNVCKFRSILNTFCIDENLKKKNGGKLKFVILGNFTNHGESIRNLNRRSRE